MTVHIGYTFQASRTARGTAAELSVAKYLRAIGYRVKVLRHAGYDIIATHKATGKIIRLEIKFSSKNLDGKFRATTIKENATDHRKSDFIIFVCQNIAEGGSCTSFIIPSYVQGDKTSLCVTSNPTTYNGKLSVWREQWHILAQ